MKTIKSPWLVVPRPRRHAQLRLFCFPYAGGGASAFREWTDLLPDTIELVAVQPPGRETRFAETPLTAMPPMIAGLADSIEAHLDIPYACFGHSLGTLVSYELVHELIRRGCEAPRHMVMSGRIAPQLEREPLRAHLRPDAEFIEELRRMQGTPPEVLEDLELMRLLLPALRADFSLACEYRDEQARVLPCGLSVFGGLGDHDVKREQLLRWQDCSVQPIALRMFPGGHFFLHGARFLVVQALVRDLFAALDQRTARAAAC